MPASSSLLLQGLIGFQVLLNQCALVVARARQPDILHMVVGSGHDGKTLVFVDHLQAVFGTALSCAPCAMLQADREFQVQGVNFLHAAFITFDECKREQGIMEDIIKVFVGGGWLPLGRNHEAETKYGHWAQTGKVWAMNTGDIPKVPTAEEISHQRRFRCTYMRSKFTAVEDEVDIPNKVFQADPTDGLWRCCVVFLSRFPLPASSARCPEMQRCRAIPQTTDSPDPDQQTVPDQGLDGLPAVDTSNQSTAERIVRETHAAIQLQFFSAATWP